MMGIFDFFGTIGSGWLSDRFDNPPVGISLARARESRFFNM
jgi:hypothetical protein